jgi:DNA-binding CsgD family transcriptional regulator
MFGERGGATCVPNRRETLVIELVAQGLTNRDVARALGTTEYVIKNCLRTIYDKLGLWNRVELALWFEARKHENQTPVEVARLTHLQDSTAPRTSEIN